MAKQVAFEPQAWEEFTWWQTEDNKTQKKIYALIKDIQRDPFSGTGKPEPLKHQRQGYWSRRIDKTNRLVYKVTDESIIIISCKHHYALK